MGARETLWALGIPLPLLGQEVSQAVSSQLPDSTGALPVTLPCQSLLRFVNAAALCQVMVSSVTSQNAKVPGNLTTHRQ